MTVTPDLPVILVSHRSPVSFTRTADGPPSVTRGAGGLVTALTGLADRLADAVWVCAAADDDDRAVLAERGPGALHVGLAPTPHLREEAGGAHGMDVHLLDLDTAQHEDFYGVVSNPLLWFVQHGLYGLSDAPTFTAREHDAYADGYVPVNEAFADAVVTQVHARGGRALVLLHDYHLYLVGARVRASCPDVVISHFVHIPMPGPDGWRVLPPPMRADLLRGLLGCDVVGFHTWRFARNFLLVCREVLGLAVDLDAMTVAVDGRTVHARAYPISIDPASLAELVATDEVREHQQSLQETFLADGGRLVLRVDRTDPSKNIVRGFQAFGAMLDAHPEMVGSVTFLAMLQPSRQDVPEYADYVGGIGAAVAEVNARHGSSERQAIDLRMADDLPFAVAAYSLCDVLVVNAVNDGMNLVAKEMVVCNTRDGVLALSENTGAHEELGAFAVTLAPFDVAQQAAALHEALTRPREQRAADLAGAAEQVRTHDVARWLDTQLADLAEVAGGGSLHRAPAHGSLLGSDPWPGRESSSAR